MNYAYYRVSTDKQDYEAQKVGVTKYCDYQDITIDKEYVDEGISGTVDYKSRNLGKLINKAKAGDLIIVSEISRLSRKMVDTFELVKILQQKGVDVYCIKENMKIDSTALGLMVMSLFAFSAQVERERISERTKEALAKRKALGIALGRRKGSKNKQTIIEKKDCKEKILAMVAKGCCRNEIARKCKISFYTINNFAKDNNLVVLTKKDKNKKERMKNAG